DRGIYDYNIHGRGIITVNTQTGIWSHQELSYDIDIDLDYFFRGLIMDNINDILYAYLVHLPEEGPEEPVRLVTINPENSVVTEIGIMENFFPTFSPYNAAEDYNVFSNNKIYTVGLDPQGLGKIFIVNPADASFEQIDLGEEAIRAAVFKDESNDNLYALTSLFEEDEEEETCEFIIHSIDKENNTLHELFRLPYQCKEENIHYGIIRISFNSVSKNLIIFGSNEAYDYLNGSTINLPNQNYVVHEAELENSDHRWLLDFFHGNCTDGQVSVIPAKKDVALTYNNPASGIVHIKSDDKKSGKIILYNNILQPVQEALLNNGEANVEINALPEGLYYFQVTRENNTSKINKLIIIK
ncbi:MAG: hypothetical protein ACK4ND_04900, partial [Cytophagaceae bacterium]